MRHQAWPDSFGRDIRVRAQSPPLHLPSCGPDPPSLHARGWTEDLIRREETAGAVEIVDGRARRQAKGRIDYTLRIKINPETQRVGSTLDSIQDAPAQSSEVSHAPAPIRDRFPRGGNAIFRRSCRRLAPAWVTRATTSCDSTVRVSRGKDIYESAGEWLRGNQSSV